MKHYVEITLLPDVDISLNFLLQKVYQQLHLKFVEMKEQKHIPPAPLQRGESVQPVGISFPKYHAPANTLGDKIRLFAHDVATLEQFNAKQTLRKLSDYVHVTNIRDVPPNVQTFACFQRLQLKTSNLRLARRKAKRENVNVEIALSKLEGFNESRTTVPFVVIKSVSNGETFRLFVVCHEQSSDNCAARFGTYGLSSTSTVPIF